MSRSRRTPARRADESHRLRREARALTEQREILRESAAVFAKDSETRR
jgi:hypothetical protein